MPPKATSRDEIRDDDRVSYVLAFAMIALTALYLLTFSGVLGNFGRSPPEAAQEIGSVLSPVPSHPQRIKRTNHDE